MDTPSTAYKANNKYANFPPMMHDGRNITSSWQPGTFVDEAIRKDNNIVSNWQYRKYLTDNAEQIRNHNFKQACNDVGYYVRNEPDGSDRSTTYRTPYVYKDSQAPVQHIGASASELKRAQTTQEIRGQVQEQPLGAAQGLAKKSHGRSRDVREGGRRS